MIPLRAKKIRGRFGKRHLVKWPGNCRILSHAAAGFSFHVMKLENLTPSADRPIASAVPIKLANRATQPSSVCLPLTATFRSKATGLSLRHCSDSFRSGAKLVQLLPMKTTDIRRQSKQKRREKLVKAFQDQYQLHGFDETNLESVALAAGLHVQTLYRHFPKKKDLLVAYLEKNLEEFKSFMADREKDALAAWRDWVELNATRLQTAPLKNAHIPEEIDRWHRYEATLAEEIAKDLGVDTDRDIQPLLIACMLVSTNRHVARDLYTTGNTQNWVADLLSIVDKVMSQFPDLPGSKNP